MQPHTFEVSSAQNPRLDNYIGTTDDSQAPSFLAESPEHLSHSETATLRTDERLRCPACGKPVSIAFIRVHSTLPDGEACLWHLTLEGLW